MGWKNWPYWIKGGIIFGFIPIITLFLVFIYSRELAALIFIFLFGFGVPAILDDLGYTTEIATRAVIIWGIPIIIWFIIGSVIGWIYGKIKSRKMENRI